jgi:hypothetical protein
MSAYPFAAADRIENPASYMYIPFGGEAFLRGYADARAVARAALLPLPEQRSDDGIPEAAARVLLAGEQRFSRQELAQIKGLCAGQGRSPTRREKPTLEATAGTEEVLFCVLASALSSGSHDDWSAAVMTRLIARFEVAKRLHERYARDFRVAEGRFDSVAVYARFGLALAILHAQSRDLRALNCLLKVNDLLASIGHRMSAQRPSVVCEAFVSLAAERAAVLALAETHGVPPRWNSPTSV